MPGLGRITRHHLPVALYPLAIIVMSWMGTIRSSTGFAAIQATMRHGRSFGVSCGRHLNLSANLGAVSTSPSTGSEVASVPADSSSGGEEEVTYDVNETIFSPTRVTCFQDCPKLYEFRHIQRLPESTSQAQLGGILIHDALSKFFSLPIASRNIHGLHQLFKESVLELIRKQKEGEVHPQHYRSMFANREEEKKWAMGCLDLLGNFLVLESWKPDVDVEAVEMRMSHSYVINVNKPQLLQASLPSPPKNNAPDGSSPDLEVNSSQEGDGEGEGEGEEEEMTVKVTGIIDRLDRLPSGKLRVVDYKTGKVPNLKYTKAANKRIMDSKFFQLKVYALLVEAEFGEVPEEMSLVYLAGPSRCYYCCLFCTVGTA
ncbi:unnamed protein product [Choristocarpus tenellus]